MNGSIKERKSLQESSVGTSSYLFLSPGGKISHFSTCNCQHAVNLSPILLFSSDLHLFLISKFLTNFRNCEVEDTKTLIC